MSADFEYATMEYSRKQKCSTIRMSSEFYAEDKTTQLDLMREWLATLEAEYTHLLTNGGAHRPSKDRQKRERILSYNKVVDDLSGSAGRSGVNIFEGNNETSPNVILFKPRKKN